MPKDMPKPEALKNGSRFLRGGLSGELSDGDLTRLSSDSDQLMKFHGMYQQKSRDAAQASGHVLMVRGRIPGGRLTCEQWKVWDQVADDYGSGGIRVTTRQGLQLHGVLHSNAKALIQTLHRALQTSSGACGDVVRNVTQAVNPWADPRLSQLDEVTDFLSHHFRIRSGAYHEIFLDGENVSAPAEEPIYGSTYLPRKFKIAVTIAGNNSVDIYTNDLGFAATFGKERQIDGYFVFAGGGMGMSHNRPETFPRLADYLGWIPKAGLIPIAEAAVSIQREFGDRGNRKHARLKYTISEKGVEWFRELLQKRSQINCQARSLMAWNTPSYLGWTESADGTLGLGLHTLSGRLVDQPGRFLKSAIAQVVEQFQLSVQLTPDQDVILLGIPKEARDPINQIFQNAGLATEVPKSVFRRAVACVALPMCGKALAEGERMALPFLTEVQQLLETHGLSQKAPVVRITGCPNGCSRPYAAELALVGQLPDQYAIYLGGNREGTRLASRALEKVPLAEVPEVLTRLFGLWKEHGEREELLGDFVTRWPRRDLLEKIQPNQDWPTLNDAKENSRDFQ